MQVTNGHVFGLSISPIITVLYFSFLQDGFCWQDKINLKRSYCNCCEGNHRAVSINLTKYGRLSCKKDTAEAGGYSCKLNVKLLPPQVWESLCGDPGSWLFKEKVGSM